MVIRNLVSTIALAVIFVSNNVVVKSVFLDFLCVSVFHNELVYTVRRNTWYVISNMHACIQILNF